MNKTGYRLVLAGLGVMVSVAAGPVRAREKASSTPEAKPAESVAEVRVGSYVLVLADNARRLRALMGERMNLSTQQVAEIDRIFDLYVDEVMTNGQPTKLRGRDIVRNKILAPTYPQMAEDLKIAEALGDATQVAALKQAMANRRREPILPAENQSDLLLAKVKEHLQADQVAGFEKIVTRWQAISPGDPHNFPLDRLRRALNDPDAELSTETKEQVVDRLRKALMEIQSNQDKSLGAREAEVEKARVDIFAKLTPDQQKTIDATLRYFKESEKVYTMPVAVPPAGEPKKAESKEPAAALVGPKAGDSPAPSAAKPTAVDEAKPTAVNEAKPAAPNETKPAESKP